MKNYALGLLCGFLFATLANPTISVFQEMTPRLLQYGLGYAIHAWIPEPPLDRLERVPEPPMIGSAVGDPRNHGPEVAR